MNCCQWRFFVFALIAIVVFSSKITAAESSSHSSDDLRCETNQAIGTAVARLQDVATFHSALLPLTAAPATGACHLMKALKIVSDEVVLPAKQRSHSETMKVIWSLRALCSITDGLRFTAGTQHHFNMSEEAERQRGDFLRGRNGELHFFAVWMSRDILYIAPRDVQAAIIDKWIKWYAANGTTFNYSSGEGWEACYF